MKALRMTEEQLQEIKNRIGKVREHRIAIPEEEMPASLQRAKYRNKKTEVDGIVFDSKKEAARYKELKLLKEAGEIWDLKCHVSFVLRVNGIKICRYVCDFQYKTNEGSVVEDVKGFKTRAYLMKKRLMLAIHGIEIRET